MYKPPYWFHKNIKFPETELDEVISKLKKLPHAVHQLSSYYLQVHNRPDKVWRDKYEQIVEEIVRNAGMYTTTRYTWAYWSQFYQESQGHKEHEHSTKSNGEISWVHFLKTNDKKFVFTDMDGHEYIPAEQNKGDIICFPSYCFHYVKPNNNQERFVVAGNITFQELSRYE